MAAAGIKRKGAEVATEKEPADKEERPRREELAKFAAADESEDELENHKGKDHARKREHQSLQDLGESAHLS